MAENEDDEIIEAMVLQDIKAGSADTDDIMT
jgi:hypothetical protein